MNTEDELEPIWRGLANPTRRRMLDALRAKPLSTGDLAAAVPEASRFSVMQHLKVLVQGNLVVQRKEGRQRINTLNPVPIQQIYDRWVRNYERPLLEALVDMKSRLEDGDETKSA